VCAEGGGAPLSLTYCWYSSCCVHITARSEVQTPQSKFPSLYFFSTNLVALHPLQKGSAFQERGWVVGGGGDTFELDLLLVLELPHSFEGQVYVIQGEEVKFGGQFPRDDLVVHEHLAHLVARHRDVYWGLQWK